MKHPIATRTFFQSAVLAVILSLGASVCSAQNATRKIDVMQQGSQPKAPAGCDPETTTALNASGNFTYGASVATAAAVITPPTSYSNCLTGMLNGAQSALNLFNGSGGGDIGNLLTTFAQNAVKGMVTQLETQACQQINSVVGGGSSSFTNSFVPTNLTSTTFPSTSGH